MKQIKLGRSELMVSRVAFGTWQLGGDWGETDEDAAIRAIRRALQRGVSLFDTAQGYGFGKAERLLAKALSGVSRDDVVIATKGGLRPLGGAAVARDSSPDWIRRGVVDSLAALDTDYIDLLQVHWPDPAIPLAETAGALATLVDEGKVRHVGVSNFSVEQMDAFSATLPVETVQPPYHLFHRDVEADVLPYTAAHDIGMLVYGPLAHGLLSGHLRADSNFTPGDWRAKSQDFQGEPYQRNLKVVATLERIANVELGVSISRLAVAWTLANPAVHVAIVGTRNPDHVDDAVAAAELELSDDVLHHIDDVMRDATPVAGPRPEAI
jgi:aryl-alcohol dehydrogenase-like predicted oxidoreductase